LTHRLLVGFIPLSILPPQPHNPGVALKPGNTNGKLVVKLVDFGLAKSNACSRVTVSLSGTTASADRQ